METVRVGVVAERSVDRHESVRTRRLHHAEERVMPEVVPVLVTRAAFRLGVRQHHIVGIAAADIGCTHALRRGIVG